MESTAAERCDVLVVGAGPAGSAAAAVLARKGIDVLLADRRASPRDKVCGDALIPDAIAALGSLGILEAVRRRAHAAGCLDLIAPDRSRVRLRGEVLVLPRRTLDHMLVEHAQACGARIRAPLELRGFLESSGAVAGAEFEEAAPPRRLRVAARLTLLATGAASGPLELAGLCTRKAASGFAVRQYVRNQRAAAVWREPTITFDRTIRPGFGYGWVFPGPDATFNVGAGVFFDRPGRAGPASDRVSAHAAGPNARRVFERFITGFAPARELLAEGVALGPLKGAPLRTALAGAALGRAGLLAVGEAAGTTYSFSGEGIGKALETGVLAAELIAAGWPAPSASLAAEYANTVRSRYGRRFAAYETAQRWLARPAFADFLAARARARPEVLARLEELLNETSDPRELFSWRGLLSMVGLPTLRPARA
ncbi:MAG TPA: FAD-dependent monooxygenase [Burkholderiaceae bacterium]